MGSRWLCMIYLFIFGDKSFNFSGKTIYFSFQVKEVDDKDIYIYIYIFCSGFELDYNQNIKWN